jgi:hypothetical protein
MLLTGSASGLPAVGIGVLGWADEALLTTARRFVKRMGATEPVLLAMSTGRLSAHGLTVPRLNTSPLLVIGPTRWWIADRHGERFHARGRTGDIVGTFIAGDGVTVCFSEKQNAKFTTGDQRAYYVKALVDVVLAHARLSAAKFAAVAPGQPPLMLVGTYVAGRGADLAPGEPCVVAVSGRGVCATGAGSSLLRPANGLRAVHISGLTSATENPAVANLMNTLMMRRHVDCLVRFVFDDAEATFSLTGDTPDRLQLDAAALIAAVRQPPAPPRPQATPQPAAQPTAQPSPQQSPQPTASEAPTGWVSPAATAPVTTAPVTNAPAATAEPRFCGHCGARREPAHTFCVACGRPFDA